MHARHRTSGFGVFEKRLADSEKEKRAREHAFARSARIVPEEERESG
jgi:hypothetical protein